MPDENKRCPRCAQTKPRSEFHKNVRTHDGLAWQCNSCMSAYMKQYRSRRHAREKHRAYMRSYQRRDYVKAKAKEYYAREDVKQRVREYQRSRHSNTNTRHPLPSNPTALGPPQFAQ